MGQNFDLDRKFYYFDCFVVIKLLFHMIVISVQGVSKKRGPFFEIGIIPLLIKEFFPKFCMVVAKWFFFALMKIL